VAQLSTLGGLNITKHMTTQTKIAKLNERLAEMGLFTPLFRPTNTTTPTSVRYAIIGLFMVGTVGIAKALHMSSPLGVLVCLLGSAAAFGSVVYLRLRKN